ncbi:MAG: C40 family peptidase [Bacteroidales bacterium]|jgi:cell wall-associated NlpC family hydrolase|nr:C40 family peptidase [Bacteroidales bacterium]NCU35423.1 hydrolase Nlp/P60 [Candidatus Falkowbacteria bacterium]MDD2632154.1 C40 family peptidase [Bacteroidales bacterium]MDD3525526.1 C40 family peptidase [Bacteroidales bacterium]MDD4176219.1 C40 family peptidase [Bacteroidales bacterium]
METFGFCNLSCVPLRAAASHRSEMVSQLLFGDTFEIMGTEGSWLAVQCSHDDYQGFIDDRQCLLISDKEYQQLQQAHDQFAQDAKSYVTDQAGNRTLLFPAANMRGFHNGQLVLGATTFSFDELLQKPALPVTGANLIASARQYLNAPYLWGGRTTAGIDCSGLTQNVFKQNGIALHRDAAMQATQGETIHLIWETHAGDLAFFDNAEGEITHAGIITGEGTIIHASGFVRIDDIDHQGIFDSKIRKYTHKLRIIKRLIDG